MEGMLVIHQARHPYANVHWLYTAVSRATGPSNARVVDDVHRSVSNMTCQKSRSWVSRKVLDFIYADVTAGHLRADEGKQFRENLGQELLSAYLGKCNLCSSELVWAVCIERRPTLDRLHCALPHTIGNVDVKCLKCNRARGSLGRRCTKKNKGNVDEAVVAR